MAGGGFLLKIPDLQTGITRKTIKGTTYVYYTYGRTYISEKKYSQGKDTSIGKVDPSDDTMMYPNTNFIRFFPDPVPEEVKPPERSEIVTANKGKFEDDYSKNIRGYKVYGMTVHQKLFPSDEKDRHFHLFYSDSKKASEKNALTSKIEKLAKYFKKHQNQSIHFDQALSHYFDLIYWHEGEKDEKFMYAREKTDVINQEIGFCGYFVIVTSAEMTATRALELYKGRDVSEKLFRADKSFLGNRTMRAHMNETEDARIFVEFVALIVRNRIYHQLTLQEKRTIKKKTT